MTLRALAIGLLAAMFIAGPGYINDQVLRLESVTAGHQLPISVFALAGAIAGLSALLGLVRGSWRLAASELSVIVALMLVACSIPGRGLMESFPPAIATPAMWNEQMPGWKRTGILSYTPPEMLCGGGAYEGSILDGYLRGLGGPGAPIGLDSVPWRAWATPLATWLPLVFLTAAAAVCVALIVHRQWSGHERLRYPIAQFATSVLGGTGPGGLLRRRLFWIALGTVLAIHLVNGYQRWNQHSIVIPLTYDFRAIGQACPAVSRAPWGPNLLTPTLYPCVIGFAFFIASELSLTMGLSQVLVVTAGVFLLSLGVDLQTDYFTGGSFGWQKFGSYLAMTLVVLYLGRNYFGRVLAQALGLGNRGVERHVAWACRVLLGSLAAMVALLAVHGLDWTLAVLTVGLMMVLLVIISRISAETGLFFVQARWLPIGVMLGMLGGYSMGPQGMVIVGMVCAVLCVDASQALLPYLVNALKICDDMGVRPSRVGASSIMAYVLGVLLSVGVVLWANYNYGAPRGNWGFERTPKSLYGIANSETLKIELQGRLEASENLSPLGRLATARPSPQFLAWTAAGLVGVLLLSVLRLRLTWWPLHPVLLLLWATWPMAAFSASFLVGWFIKTALVKLGGHARYAQLKPLMVGLIAGDLLGLAFWMVFGAVYYGVTGVLPVSYSVMPR